MVGILLVTHGKLGEELLETAKAIIGEELENAKALSVEWNNHMTEISNKIANALKELDKGDGVLLLTDMFGGTPSNVSFSFIGEKNIEVLTGVNLPMIIKIYNHRNNSSLEVLAKLVMEQGRKSITLGSEFLSAQKKS
jgi:PTS system mannose-specific IIA component